MTGINLKNGVDHLPITDLGQYKLLLSADKITEGKNEKM